MDTLKLIEQLKIDEGKKLVVYKDSLGYPTVGVGHLVTKNDNLKLGDKITEDKCNDLLANDLVITIKNCSKLFPKFEEFPDALQQIIANMMFNLGYGGLSGFKRFIKGVNTKDYKLAALSMEQSLWYKQVGIRAKRLVKEMRNLI